MELQSWRVRLLEAEPRLEPEHKSESEHKPEREYQSELGGDGVLRCEHLLRVFTRGLGNRQSANHS